MPSKRSTGWENQDRLPSMARGRSLHRSVPALAAALVGVLVATTGAAALPPPSAFHWKPTPTGTDSRLRGLDAVSRRVAWTSGSEGTVLRTVDAGSTWSSVGPPHTRALEFRDVEAFDSRRAP